jgi:hypothetical protein
MRVKSGLTEIKHEPSFEELRDLVDEAVQEKFPLNDVEYPWRRRFFIKNMWTSKVLLQREYHNENDDSKYGIINFSLNHDPGQGKYAVALGEMVAVSIMAVPKDGGDGVIIDEAGRRNANSDAAKINQAIRALLATLNDNDLEEETINTLNSKMLAPINGEGDFQDFGEVKHTDKPSAGKRSLGKSDEGQDPDQKDTITEAWNSLPGETFTEAFGSALSEAEIDYENLILKNVVVLGPTSTNGRKYPVETQESALSLFEGIRAYVNHPKLNEMSEPRDMRDLIGEHKNLRMVGDKTVSDLYLIDNAVVRDVVLPLAESKPHLAGNSIVARGKMVKEKDGTYKVEQILAARSIDIVTEPATTNSLFTEGKQFSSEEEEMDLKTLTMETLKKDRPDLFEAVTIALQAEIEAKTIRETEAKALKDKVTALESKATGLEAGILERDKTIATYELEKAKAMKDSLVEGIFKAVKIPDRVKYTEKDGVKAINPHFRSLLERCQDELETKELVRTWEETYRQGPISEEKRLDFGGNGNVSEAALDQLYRAVV